MCRGKVLVARNPAGARRRATRMGSALTGLRVQRRGPSRRACCRCLPPLRGGALRCSPRRLAPRNSLRALRALRSNRRGEIDYDARYARAPAAVRFSAAHRQHARRDGPRLCMRVVVVRAANTRSVGHDRDAYRAVVLNLPIVVTVSTALTACTASTAPAASTASTELTMSAAAAVSACLSCLKCLRASHNRVRDAYADRRCMPECSQFGRSRSDNPKSAAKRSNFGH